MDSIPYCECESPLTKVDYTIWGTKIFDSTTKSYEEDDSLGNCDMEFYCPNCSARIDPETIGL